MGTKVAVNYALDLSGYLSAMFAPRKNKKEKQNGRKFQDF